MDTDSWAQGIGDVRDIHAVRLAARASFHGRAFYMDVRDATSRFQVTYQCHLVRYSVAGSRDQMTSVELYIL
jgi:hypothetical protein